MLEVINQIIEFIYVKDTLYHSQRLDIQKVYLHANDYASN